LLSHTINKLAQRTFSYTTTNHPPTTHPKMPTCNKISGAIILPPTDTPLPEYHRRYLDSSVSVYVPVPDIPILHAAPSFNIQLWTDGYIAPGLAMFVYIDGRYQCNRSKRMPPPGLGRGDGNGGIEMRVRQKVGSFGCWYVTFFFPGYEEMIADDWLCYRTG
jgi:hypothetical protein